MSRAPEVVVITGASAGVGRATVRKSARHGARIGLVARGIDGLKAARTEAEELGSEAQQMLQRRSSRISSRPD